MRVCVCVCVCVVSTHGSLHRRCALSRFGAPIIRAVIAGKAPACAAASHPAWVPCERGAGWVRD